MQRFLPFTFLGFLLLLPLVHWQEVALTAALPKAAFFSATVLLLGLGTLVLALRDRSWTAPRRSVLIALAFFLGLALLSSILSTFPMESLRGGYVRGLGFIDLIVLTLFGWCVFLRFPPDRVRNLSGAIVLAGSLAVLPGLWEIAQGTADIRAAMGATMGHPNFLAQLLALTLPLTVALLLMEQGRHRMVVALLIALQGAGLLLCGSRAALLGTIVGIGILLGVRAKTDKRLRLWLMGLTAAITLLIGVINAAPSNVVVRNVPLLQRLVFISDDAQTESISVRKTLWTMAFAGITEQPLLGHGIGAVPAVLEQHFDPVLLDIERYDAVPDRVHNDLLERMLAGGIIGLAAWLLLAFLILRSGWIAFRESRDPLLLGIFAALIGHGVSLFFGFPTIVDLVFVTVLAAVLLKSDSTEMPLRPSVGFLAGIIVLLSTAFVLNDDVRAAVADRAFSRWTVTADREAALPTLERAHAIAPHAGYVPYLATEYLVLGRENDALALLTAALSLDRPDATLLALRGWTYLRLEVEDAARLDFHLARTFAPFSSFVWRTQGLAYGEAGNAAEAVAALEHLLSFSPRYWEWDASLEQRTVEEQRRYQVFFRQNPDFRAIFEHLAYAKGLIGDEEGAAEARRHAL